MLAIIGHAGVAAWVAGIGDPVTTPRSIQRAVAIEFLREHRAPEVGGEDAAPSLDSAKPAPSRAVAKHSPLRRQPPRAAAPVENDPAPSPPPEVPGAIPATPRPGAFLASADSEGSGDPGTGSGAGSDDIAGLGPSGGGKGHAEGTVKAHGPRLRAVSNVCRGVFPNEAEDDSGLVTVSLKVAPTGKPIATRIVAESPSGQGFAQAARACAKRLVFEPAADEHGAPVASSSVVRLRFARR